MSEGDVLCKFCGWRNESSARRCGGCGRPLRDGEPVEAAPSAPTLGWSPTVPLPGPAPAAGSASRPMPGSPVPSARAGRKGNVGRAALAAVILLALALAIAWSAVIRPAIHAQVDGQLRGLLDAGVRQATAPLSSIPQGQHIPTLQITVTAADLTDQLRAQIPPDSPLKDVAVSFTGGRMVIAYTALNLPGAVSTTLSVAGARLVAGDTRVDGPLGLVESGDEMQAAIDEALAQAPTAIPIKSASADADTLTIIVGS